MDENEPTLQIDLEIVVSFLSKIELFKNLTQSSLRELAASVEIAYIQAGATLIQQGDHDTSMFILYQGRLRVFKEGGVDHKITEETVAEISVGQFVGEIALLTHLPRTRTVRAVRDSILFELDERAFKQFEINYPDEVINIAKTALTRLVIKPKSMQIGENIISLAIAPAGESNHRPFVARLAKEISKTKSVVVINRELYNSHFGVVAAQNNIKELDSVEITLWLRSLESQYDFLIYETDQELTSWTQCCLKRADRFIFVAESAQPSTLNSIEILVFPESKIARPYTEIVFVHPDNQKIITGSEAWLKKRACDGFHHLKLNSHVDFDRFIRFFTGRAFGVVLNGGGARGLAHIGVLKALEELQIPIDFIAGSSAGAGVGGMYASSGLAATIDFSEHLASSIKKEWTLPMISLFKGKIISELCQNFWKDTNIEDLWTPFFCVSTNVTQAKLKIHDRGKMWLAIRASISVPALYPPVYTEDGCMLVDGGVINNMPVDIMRKMICGGKVLTVDCHKHSLEMMKKKSAGSGTSGWKLFLQKFNPFSREKVEYDNILNIVLGSMDAGFSFQQNLMAKEADYYLQLDTDRYSFLDFPQAHEIIELGYRTSMEKLPGLLGL